LNRFLSHFLRRGPAKLHASFFRSFFPVWNDFLPAFLVSSSGFLLFLELRPLTAPLLFTVRAYHPQIFFFGWLQMFTFCFEFSMTQGEHISAFRLLYCAVILFFLSSPRSGDTLTRGSHFFFGFRARRIVAATAPCEKTFRNMKDF